MSGAGSQASRTQQSIPLVGPSTSTSSSSNTTPPNTTSSNIIPSSNNTSSASITNNPQNRTINPTTLSPSPPSAGGSSSAQCVPAPPAPVLPILVPTPVLPRPALPVTQQKMSAVTALINPLTACKGGKAKVSIYSLLNTGLLAFEQRLLGETVSKIKGAQGPAQLLNNSYLSSIVIDDAVHVFGVTTENKLALVSPAYQVTDVDIASGFFAGCSDGDSDGWFFFQAKDVKTNTKPIYEMPVWGNKESAKKLEGLIKPCDNTKIAACYDGEHRWIAYQSADNYIVLRNVDTDKHAIVENSKWTTQVESPLGLVYVPGHSTRGHIFIYYLHQDATLRRAFIEIDETFDFRGYGEEVAVDKAVNIANFTQLTVVADPTCKTNFVYAARTPSTKQVATIADHWGASITRLQEYYWSQIKHNHLIGNEKEGHHHGPGHVHHGNTGGDYTFTPGRPGSEYGGGGIHFGGGSRGGSVHEHGGWPRSPPPSYPHSHTGQLPHGHTHGLPFGDMSDLEVELGKVKMNALLKMCFGEPRVEYYNRPVHYGHGGPHQHIF
ncbi:hypothetical protein AA313_de0203006 [Arthrobotrys entomopaga]|nr:hypothetical protein AA313_de0203006 [Arthrobotrys entomopaga]